MIYLGYYLIKCPLITVALGVHLALGKIGQGELSTSSPILSEILAARRLQGSVGRGVARGKFILRSSWQSTGTAQPAQGTCKTWSWRCLVSIAAPRKCSGQ